jgi:hypothetical protein
VMKKLLFVVSIVLPFLTSAQQNDSVAVLLNKLSTFYKDQPFRIHLTIAQPKYSLGDTVFFKGCILKFQSGELIRDKQIIAVSLKGEGDQELYQRVLFKDGWGSGQLIIPDNFEPGIYRLVAFSENHVSENGEALFLFDTELVIAGKQELVKRQIDASVRNEIAASATPQDGSIVISIKIANGTLAGKPLFVVLNRFDEVFYSERVLCPESLSFEVAIPQSKVNGKNFQLAVFSSDGTLVGEQTITRGVPVEGAISVSFNKASYQTREEVNASIKITQLEMGTALRYSVSVFHHDLLESDSSTSHKFSFTDQPAASWRQILAYNNGGKKIIQSNSAYFKGQAIYSDTGEPVPDSTLITFYLHENDFFYGLYTRKGGQFVFPLFKDFGDEEVFFAADYKGKALRNVRIKLWSYQVKSDKINFSESGRQDRYGVFANYRSLINRSYGYYASDKSKAVAMETDDIDADYEVNMSKFETFSTMSEVLSNIVSMVKYQESNGLGSIRIFLKKNSNFAKDDPVYIIDGVMTDNTNYFLGLNPSQVVKIKILRTPEKLSRFGIIGRNGVVIVNTRIQQNFLNIPRTEKTLYVKGINQPLPFKNISHASRGLAIPDLRTLLYWDNKTSDFSQPALFHFFTGDAVGKYKLRIDGLQDNGQFFSVEDIFEVYFKPTSD